MVTSLGLSAPTSCAAARAGLSRAMKLDNYPVKSSDDGSIDGVVAHAVPLLTQGFEGDQRLVRLAEAAFADLRSQIPESVAKNGRVGFYVSIPDVDRQSKSTGKGLEEKLRAGDAGNFDRGRPIKIFRCGVGRGGFSSPAALRWVSTEGSTGFVDAFQKAAEDLKSGAVTYAIVGGVDSLLDEGTISWLESTERLKSPDLPSGLQPGEAAGFILLEHRGTARSRGARVAGSVVAAFIGKEANTLFSGEPSTGVGLAKILKDASDPVSSTQENPFWVISDQNGESYRAFEWGNALFRLSAMKGETPPLSTWYPAASFGDTGSAFGAVGTCLALTAFSRKYAPATRAVLAGSSEWSTRAAIVLEGPEPQSF